MIENDIIRLIQCLTCGKNPRDCGCNDSDEDEVGLCTKYERQEECS